MRVKQVLAVSAVTVLVIVGLVAVSGCGGSSSGGGDETAQQSRNAAATTGDKAMKHEDSAMKGDHGAAMKDGHGDSMKHEGDQAMKHKGSSSGDQMSH